MVLPLESNGIDDMFPARPFDYDEYAKKCMEKYGLETRYDWAIDFFGGRTQEELEPFSKILFLNGWLDPWYPGGVQRSIHSDLIAHLSDSAHHLDLRSPHPSDPDSVIESRNLYKIWINKWIRDK